MNKIEEKLLEIYREQDFLKKYKLINLLLAEDISYSQRDYLNLQLEQVSKSIADSKLIDESKLDLALDQSIFYLEVLFGLEKKEKDKIIKNYLINGLNDQIKKMMIIYLIENQYSEEFLYLNNELEIYFVPRLVNLPNQNDLILNLINKYQENLNNNPSLLNMVVDEINYLAIDLLPFNIEEDDIYFIESQVEKLIK